MFAVMDGHSRFILSHDISCCKKGHDPTGLFREAEAQAGRPPRALATDGLDEFIKPVLEVFRTRAGHRFAHLREMYPSNQFNHNSVRERFNGGIGDRIKVARGFNSDRPAPVRLMIVHHSLFWEHEGTGGKMPAQAAGIEMEGKDKWEIVIANAVLASA